VVHPIVYILPLHYLSDYCIYKWVYNCGNISRDICKVRKREHQHPEFGHIQGEIKKKPATKYIGIQGVGVKLKKPSILMVPEFHPVFFPDRLHCCYIDFQSHYLSSNYNSSRTLCIKC